MSKGDQEIRGYGNMATYGYLAHHGILGQKWGIRRYQNPDGSLTEEGRRRYGVGSYRRGDSPEKTLKNLKNIHEAEKQGNLKGVYDNYFTKDETAVSLSKLSTENAKIGTKLDQEIENTAQKYFNDKYFIKDVINECAKNIVEENHPEGGGGRNIYGDDIYDYYLNAYADMLKKKNPKIDQLEKTYKENAKQNKIKIENYVDSIVGDLASEKIYSEEGIFGFKVEPRFYNEVQSLVSRADKVDISDYLHYGGVKEHLDMQEMVYDDIYNYSKEIENALKEKGMRVIW